MKKSLLISSLCISVALVAQPSFAEVKIRASGASAIYKFGNRSVR